MSELNLQVQGMVCGIFRILKVRANCSVELLFVLMYVQAERGFAIYVFFVRWWMRNFRLDSIGEGRKFLEVCP